MPSSYQFVLWKQECFLVPSPFFRILLEQTGLIQPSAETLVPFQRARTREDFRYWN